MYQSKREALEVAQEVYASMRKNGHNPTGITAAELFAKEFPALRYCVEGLLPEGVWFLAGKPKLGKSWLALQLALSIASGSKALGGVYRTDPGDVLYLALEDGQRRLQQRLKKLLPAGDPPERLTFFNEWPKLDAGGPEHLDRWLYEHPDCRLVVIDTLKKVRPKQPGRSLYVEDYEAVEPLAPVARDHGVTILVVHHLRQSDADDPYDMISGSTGLTAGVDGALILKRERGRADAFLYADGRDLEETVEIALEWSKSAVTWTAKGPAEEYRVSQQRAAIIRIVSAFGDEGAGPRTVHETLADEGTKISYDTVRALMVKMSRDGQLESPKRGVYVCVHNVHNVHNADTYRTENVNAKEAPVHNVHNKRDVNGNVNAVHNQKAIPMLNVNDVNDVNAEDDHLHRALDALRHGNGPRKALEHYRKNNTPFEQVIRSVMVYWNRRWDSVDDWEPAVIKAAGIVGREEA